MNFISIIISVFLFLNPPVENTCRYKVVLDVYATDAFGLKVYGFLSNNPDMEIYVDEITYNSLTEGEQVYKSARYNGDCSLTRFKFKIKSKEKICSE